MIRNLYAIFVVSVVMLSCNQKKQQLVSFNAHTEMASDTLKPIDKWVGVYQITLNKGAEDWRDEHRISLRIKQDSIIYEAEGYQLWEKFHLDGTPGNDTLKLTFKAALDNTGNSISDSIHDFGILRFEKKQWIWESPYMDARLGEDGIKGKYILKKKP